MTDFEHTRRLFDMPDGVAYLDGNSLGPLPKSAPARVEQTMRAEWGRMAIGGWNRADWISQPQLLGDRIARLIGAEKGHVVLGDTLSIKVHQALAAALSLRPDRRVILSDSGNFPTDLYMAQGLIGALDRGYELRVVAPEDVAGNIDSSVAAMMLTQVDYRTGRLHDMASLTAKAQEAGALALWDLAHSAGALPVDLAGCNADFAMGCTYKFLNGGPGSPAFIYVAPRHADVVQPALSGWLGHAAPFDFELGYRPAPGIARMRVGTPPILALAALSASLDIWDDVDMQAVRARAIELSELFISAVETSCPSLTLASPRDPSLRGSQVSFHHPEGYAIMQALIDRGVVGDFRAPDIIRFGITPLYLGAEDMQKAADVLAQIMANDLWDNPTYRKKSLVT
ncbi:MAG: kynureninase [Rhodobacteraceae bacterium]|nr:kynureninase [Paracoccaceae bacterium]